MSSLNTRRLKQHPILLLIGLTLFGCLLIAPGVFTHGEVIAPTDILTQYYPWKGVVKPQIPQNELRSDILDGFLPRLKLFQAALKSGELPLWNPYQANGIPFITLLTNTFFHPLILLPLLLFPLSVAFTLSLFGRLVLASVSCYLFARSLKLSAVPAIITSLSFAFLGFNSVWLSWPQVLVTASAPLLFWGYERFKTNRKQATLIIPLAIAFTLLGGFPTVSLYYFLFFAAYCGLNWHQSKRSLKKLMPVVFLVAIGLGLTGFQLLPTVEYLSFQNVSQRIKPTQENLTFNAYPQHIAPYINGAHFLDNWQGELNFNESTTYPGLLALMSLIIAPILILKTKQDKRLRSLLVFFWVSSLFLILITFQITPLYRIIRLLPLLNTSSLHRLASLLIFTQSLTLGLTLQLLSENKSRSQYLKPVFVALMGVTGLALLLKLTALSFPVNAMQLPWLQSFNLFWIFLGLILLILSVQLPRKHTTLILFFILLADIALLHHRQHPTVSRQAFYPTTPGIQFLQEKTQLPERIASFDWTLFIPGTQKYYRLPAAFSHSFYQPSHKSVLRKITKPLFVTETAPIPQSQHTNFSSPWLDIFGVRYLTFPPGFRLYTSQLTQPQAAQTIQLEPDSPAIQSLKPTGDYLVRVCLLTDHAKDTAGVISLTFSQANKTLASLETSINQIPQKDWWCQPVKHPNPLNTKAPLSLMLESTAPVTVFGSAKNAHPGSLKQDQRLLKTDLASLFFFTNESIKNSYQLVYDQPDLTIYQNKQATLSAYLSSIPLASTQSLPENWPSPLPVLLEAQLELDPSCQTPPPQLIHYENDQRRYHTNAPCQTILTTNARQYPGWYVTIDQKPQPLLKTNHLFQGVLVPAGAHTVTFGYKPLSWRYGLILSAMSLIFLLGSFIYYHRKQSKQLREL